MPRYETNLRWKRRWELYHFNLRHIAQILPLRCAVEQRSLAIRIEKMRSELATSERSSKQPTLLLVDDEKSFVQRLGRAMTSRGFQVTMVQSVAEGMQHIKSETPDYCVLDMKLNDGNGFTIAEALKEMGAATKVVMLTGFGNIASAVTAIKLGAVDYIAKPADADDVYEALLGKTSETNQAPDYPMSADRVRWEHITRVYELSNRNVSETARRLKMHRRTLQRILSKRAPR